MEKKINLVELLKDCPNGMELECTMYDNLYFDKVDEEYRYPIGCYTIYDGCRTSVNFTEFGEFNNYGTAKCVIFPKDSTTWEGFHRPFKDGDIISDGNIDAICIFKGEGSIKGTVDFYCGISGSNELFIKDVKNQDEHYGYINEYNFATEGEKQRLFDAIEGNCYKWNAETKTLEKLIKPQFKVGDKIKNKNSGICDKVIEIFKDCYLVESCLNEQCTIGFDIQDNWELVPHKFDINTLKPFESKVLVRGDEHSYWKPAIFGCYIKDMANPCYALGGTCWAQCIPYEENKHLLGKTNKCDEFYIFWEE